MKLDPISLQRFRNAIKDDKATFYFVPSPQLRQKVAAGNDPILSQMPKQKIEALLLSDNGSGVVLDPEMVMMYLEDKLDERNAYLFGLGEIRVAGVRDMSIKEKAQ